MDADSQKLLANYVSGGGHLVILPRIPAYDLSLRPCEILKQSLRPGETGEIKPRVPVIEFFDIKEMSASTPVQVFNESNLEPAALLPNGDTCGFMRHLGAGWTLILGTAFGYKTQENMEAYSRIIKMNDIRGNAYSSNGRIILRESFAEKSAFIFAANYYRTSESGYITFMDPVTRRERQMPYGKPLTLAGLTGLLIPVNFPICGSQAKIIFSSSQVLSAFEKGGSIFVELHGQPASGGELALAVKKKPQRVSADGRKVEFYYKSGEAVISFKHGDEGTVMLKVD